MYENKSLWRRWSLYKFILWMLVLISFSNDCRDEEVLTQDVKPAIIYTTGCPDILLCLNVVKYINIKMYIVTFLLILHITG